MNSKSPRDEDRMQHALGTGSEPHCHARIASISSALLLRKLPKSQEYLSGHWGSPPAGVGHHRLKEEATGTRLIHRLPIDCRSALNSAGRHKIPAELATHSSRGQQHAWQCNSSHLCTTHPLSCFGLKGACASIPGPSIAHFCA